MKNAPTVKANSKELKGLDVNVLDVADYLDDAESIAKYLNVALLDPDPEMFLVAISKVARARGMTHARPSHWARVRTLAQGAGTGRQAEIRNHHASAQCAWRAIARGIPYELTSVLQGRSYMMQRCCGAQVADKAPAVDSVDSVTPEQLAVLKTY